MHVPGSPLDGTLIHVPMRQADAIENFRLVSLPELMITEVECRLLGFSHLSSVEAFTSKPSLDGSLADLLPLAEELNNALRCVESPPSASIVNAGVALKISIAVPLRLSCSYVGKYVGEEHLLDPSLSFNGLPFDVIAMLAHADDLDTADNTSLSVDALHCATSNHFVPRSFVHFLQALCETIPNPNDIFNVFPSVLVKHDLDFLDLLRAHEMQEAAVWPLVRPEPLETCARQTPMYASLRSVLVALEPDRAYLPALAAAGLPITIPPLNVTDLLRESHIAMQLLTPHAVHNQLITCCTDVDVLSPQSKAIILWYLLSTSDANHVLEIPLIPCASGAYVCLQPCSTSTVAHTLLDDEELHLFGRADPDSVPLSVFPSPIPIALRSNYNLCMPTSDYIIQMVSRVVQVTGGDAIDAAADDHGAVPPPTLDWIRQFWTWLSSSRYALQNKITDALGTMNIIPLADGTLRSSASAVFNSGTLTEFAVSALMKAGLSLLSTDLLAEVLDYISAQYHYETAHGGQKLLDFLCDPGEHAIEFSLPEAKALYFLLRCSSPAELQLSSKCQSKLRSLPLWPIFYHCADSSESIISLQSLPTTEQIRIIEPSAYNLLNMRPTLLLPSLAGITLVSSSWNGIDAAWLMSLTDSEAISLSEADTLYMFVSNLAEQSLQTQAEFLQLLTAAKSDIVSPELMEMLKTLAFLPVGDGSQLQQPLHVIDPDSEASSIFEPISNNLPRRLEHEDCTIVTALQQLECLCRTPSPHILAEQIKEIAQYPLPLARQYSVRLLHYLNTSDYDCSTLALTAEPWIPTHEDLRHPSECLDHSRYHHHALFDHVLAIADVPGIQISSSSLRDALGWSTVVPLAILKEQLRAEIAQDHHENMHSAVTIQRLSVIIRELGSRLTEIKNMGMVDDFRAILDGRQWVPAHTGDVVLATLVILSKDTLIPGFFHPHPHLLIHEFPGVQDLLLLVGATLRLPNTAIIAFLRDTQAISLSAVSLKSPDIETIVGILSTIDTAALGEDERNEIRLPDENGVMRKLKDSTFCDSNITLNGMFPHCHSAIGTDLAIALHIPTTTSRYLESLGDHASCQIRKDKNGTRFMKAGIAESDTLTLEEAASRLLLMMSNKGANSIDLLIDEHHFASDDTLFPGVVELNTRPSLIVHSEVILTDEEYP
ncbi:hypothetical protein K474DRAFT_1713635 [Panus rudis PR-1116 ss-1]|nr:hypothetical protein K474DRAFT_1713635 [Panus rudis PR-1116 ss-1]